MKTDSLTRKHKQLQALRPLPHAVTTNLDDWFRVELTYTSNAIEGNTLTRAETAAILRRGKLFKIGQLAQLTGETNPTLRFWMKEGLIAAAQRTEKGYHLFTPDMIERVKYIRKLQEQRLTLAEIREKI